MNIFITDPCPTLSAIALDNRRLNKMVLETAQLLSSACRMMLVVDSDYEDIYKSTHFNHPCAVFARKTFPNFKWLVEHGLALCQEFEHRFGKVHASEEIIFRCYRLMCDAVANGTGLALGWNTSDLVFSFNCSDFNTGDLFEDYRMCMRRKWNTDKTCPAWVKRGEPKWRRS